MNTHANFVSRELKGTQHQYEEPRNIRPVNGKMSTFGRMRWHGWRDLCETAKRMLQTWERGEGKRGANKKVWAMGVFYTLFR